MSLKVSNLRERWPWWLIRLANRWADLRRWTELKWHRLRGRTILRIEHGTERMNRIVFTRVEKQRIRSNRIHSVTVTIPRQEVMDWLMTNDIGRVEYFSIPGEAALFIFYSQDGAFQFKLRWF